VSPVQRVSALDDGLSALAFLLLRRLLLQAALTLAKQGRRVEESHRPSGLLLFEDRDPGRSRSGLCPLLRLLGEIVFDDAATLLGLVLDDALLAEEGFEGEAVSSRLLLGGGRGLPLRDRGAFWSGLGGSGLGGSGFRGSGLGGGGFGGSGWGLVPAEASLIRCDLDV
jgi:hypothetical protein